MTIDAVTRLNAALEGRYRIERELGDGGMATVYLADDLKHERKVALKVLKPEPAAVVGAERFLAEIKTTANLQHPHILPLFESGEADGFLFYVMPFVAGESLRERLDREHQLPVDGAVQIASKVAGALQAAHDQGVIHRDIKPANILLSKGEPLVSDFGIALAVGAAGGGRLTETGLSPGTPHYMSPEQATGDLSVGAASDIYALGCVLYEMLVGEPPYTGGTPQAVLGKIVTGEVPSARTERASVPLNVDAVIAKALEKVPADRFVGAREFAHALADSGFRHAEPRPAVGRPGARAWKALSAAMAALALAFGIGLTRVVLMPSPVVTAAPVIRLSMPVGESDGVYLGGPVDARFGRPAATSLALSPDGEVLVYSAWQMGEDGVADSRLYVRRLDRENPDPIEGTEGGAGPFFSPDGAWIGFAAGGTLRRVSVTTGEVETVAEGTAPEFTPYPYGATWGEDGTIVYAGERGLYRVSASGGTADIVAESGSELLAQPWWLPGGQVVLVHRIASFDPEAAEILAVDLATGSQTAVLTNAMDPRYVSTGHLLFVRQGTLMAVAFDPEELQVRGEPVALLEGVMQALFMPNAGFETGAAQFAVSQAGHVAYVPGGLFPESRSQLMRVRPDTEAEPIEMEPRGYFSLRVSPDGDRLAFTAGRGLDIGVYVHDMDRGVTQRIGTDGVLNFSVAWSPDGRSLAFDSDREGRFLNLSLYRIAADGSGSPERLAPSERPQMLATWSSTGVIAYLLQDMNDEDLDIWVLPPGGEPMPFFQSNSIEAYATFSPDGRWLA